MRTVKTTPPIQIEEQNQESKEKVEEMSKNEVGNIARRISDQLAVFPDLLRKSSYFIAVRPADDSLDSVSKKTKRRVKYRTGEFPLHIINQSKDKRKVNIELSYIGERGEFFDFLVYASLSKLWARNGCPSGVLTFRRRDLMFEMGMNPDKMSEILLVENSLVRMHITRMNIHYNIPKQESFGYSFPLVSGLGYHELKSKNNEVYFMTEFAKNSNPLLVTNHAVYAAHEDFIQLRNKPIAGTLYSFLCCNKEKARLDQDDQITLLNPTILQEQREKFLANVEYRAIKYLKESGLIIDYEKELLTDKDDGRKIKRFHFKLRNNSLRSLYRRKPITRRKGE